MKASLIAIAGLCVMPFVIKTIGNERRVVQNRKVDPTHPVDSTQSECSFSPMEQQQIIEEAASACQNGNCDLIKSLTTKSNYSDVLFLYLQSIHWIGLTDDQVKFIEATQFIYGLLGVTPLSKEMTIALTNIYNPEMIDLIDHHPLNEVPKNFKVNKSNINQIQPLIHKIIQMGLTTNQATQLFKILHQHGACSVIKVIFNGLNIELDPKRFKNIIDSSQNCKNTINNLINNGKLLFIEVSSAKQP
eukprot:NODE_284_length_10808_cov_1.215613.p4 type:complete len:246 gc:universal NODE_284_length_10808_cov_1.215613:6472-5735(-)